MTDAITGYMTGKTIDNILFLSANILKNRNDKKFETFFEMVFKGEGTSQERAIKFLDLCKKPDYADACAEYVKYLFQEDEEDKSSYYGQLFRALIYRNEIESKYHYPLLKALKGLTYDQIQIMRIYYDYESFVKAADNDEQHQRINLYVKQDSW